MAFDRSGSRLLHGLVIIAAGTKAQQQAKSQGQGHQAYNCFGQFFHYTYLALQSYVYQFE
jgi:hypothetical protein